MSRIPVSERVPTGHPDQVLRVTCDRTALPPVLILSTYRRPTTSLSEDDFHLMHATTVQLQYAELLLERLHQALGPQRGDPAIHDRSEHGEITACHRAP